MTWDNNGDNVAFGSIVCDDDGEDDTNLTGEPNFDAGSDLDLDITATAGTLITDCTFIIFFE